MSLVIFFPGSGFFGFGKGHAVVMFLLVMK